MTSLKIRYFNVNSPGIKMVVEIDESKIAKPYFRLAYNDNGTYLTGKALKVKLKESLFPDVPFAVWLPAYHGPKFHWETKTVEIQKEGYTVVKEGKIRIWDVTRERYEMMRYVFETKLRAFISIVQLVQYPKVPDGPDWRWEVYDPHWKDVRKQYVEIPVEVGKYTGKAQWILSDEDLYERFTKLICGYKGNQIDYMSTKKMVK